ncbi:DUF4253 domain-containing protein [Longispora sp. NPDC051575]|uniref:DUF4253 domain-containing protein n=1 Tax=Longispora sp. NPDC051575 TaxID=3154943 RepID=UPI0034466721
MTDGYQMLASLRADPTGAQLGVSLPPGRLVAPEPGMDADWEGPAYWLSDTAPDPALFARLRGSGLWPVLLGGYHGDENRPWADGEVEPGAMSTPEGFAATELLAEWWSQAADGAEDDGDHLGRDRRLAIVEPYTAWPGPAPAGDRRKAPDTAADDLARLLTGTPDIFGLNGVRLGLVPATRSADTIAALGWTGPVNYENDAAKYAAVLRDWEDRFGARVVAVGFDTLHVSVAAPPTTPDHALHVAAEHFAFCPDNVWQHAKDLQDYAWRLMGTGSWHFWWD